MVVDSIRNAYLPLSTLESSASVSSACDVQWDRTGYVSHTLLANAFQVGAGHLPGTHVLEHPLVQLALGVLQAERAACTWQCLTSALSAQLVGPPGSVFIIEITPLHC